MAVAMPAISPPPPTATRTDRALPGDDLGLVVGVHQQRIRLVPRRERRLVRLGVLRSDLHDVRVEGPQLAELRSRCRLGDEDPGRYAEFVGGVGRRQPVVAAGRGDDALTGQGAAVLRGE
jgi:hypothetical protein